MLHLLTLALLVASESAQNAADPGGWTIKESTDAATGKKSATASVRADDGRSRLIVRCDTINVPIVSVQYIPSPTLPALGRAMVTVVFDESRSERATWQFPGRGGFHDDPIDVWLLVSGITTSKKIRVEVEGEEKPVATSRFAGPGSDTLFRTVYETCGFPFEQPPVPVNAIPDD